MDQLQSRRLERLTGEIVQQMMKARHPSHSGDEPPTIKIPIDPNTVTDTRRAARIAGDRMGWKVSTHVYGDELHVVDRSNRRRGPRSKQ